MFQKYEFEGNDKTPQSCFAGLGELFSAGKLQRTLQQGNGIDSQKTSHEENAGMEELEEASQGVAQKWI